ncbi:MAG TPA: DUF4097 family beta strand repeat-containing protein [Pirellulales bacterium]|nr:DUF4097 family beta strand repeat-containing protein [Pirellulales bacterium]
MVRVSGSGATVRAQPFTAERERSETFTTGDSPTVKLDLFSGPITVKPSGEAGVKVKVIERAGGETQAEAEENLKLIDLDVQQDDGKIKVTSRRNQQDFIGLLETAAELEVPPGSVLDLRTGFGAANVSTVGASVTIHAASGPITIQGGVGELNLASEFGDVTVDGEHAKVEIRTANGQVSVAGAKGPVNVSSGFGAITIRSAAGKVHAKTTNGAIKVAGGPGPMELTSDFGDIEVSADAAPVTAKTGNGKITLTGGDEKADLRTDFGAIEVRQTRGAVTAHSTNGAIQVLGGEGPFDVSSNFGDIKVEAAGAPVVARTSNGNIVLKGGKGRVEAHSEFGAIELAAEQASVTAHSTNGPIHFSGTLLDGMHSLTASFGDITLSLPADARFRIDAKTDFGSVKCGFDVSRSDSSTESHLIGEVGKDPPATLKIVTSNGAIEVKRANDTRGRD